ncbi:helix-turn-helix domain-containing protein [Streptomyces brevispora]|uniref:helix-turn-helix domain-containing protein n=1 Tax=Streptomyces brevispora TaxID=887462 RepID=UPI00371318CA
MTIKHIAMVLEAEGIDGAEKLLLIAYCNRTDDYGYCWPGQHRLADDCGTSVATVKRVKKRLVEKELIASKRRLDPRTGEPITNLTRVNIELLAAMKRKPRVYDDNVIERITFAADVPLPTKKKKKAPRTQTDADQLKAQDEPDPVDNADTPSDQLKVQDEPDPGPEMSPTSGQLGPGVVGNLSPGSGQVDPLNLSHPPEKPHTTVLPSIPTSADGIGQKDGMDGQVDPVRVREQPQVVKQSEGVSLLQAVAFRRPELTLTGRVLTDQGLMVTGLLASGWAPQNVMAELLRPLPAKTRSVGAVISKRLATMASTPVPKPMQMPMPRMEEPGPVVWEQYEQTKVHQRQTVPDRSPHQSSGSHHGYAAERWKDCAECYDPIFTYTGSEVCAKCLSWPVCKTCSVRVAPEAACDFCHVVPVQTKFEVCEVHGEQFVPGTVCFQCSVPRP